MDATEVKTEAKISKKKTHSSRSLLQTSERARSISVRSVRQRFGESRVSKWCVRPAKRISKWFPSLEAGNCAAFDSLGLFGIWGKLFFMNERSTEKLSQKEGRSISQ